MNKSKIVLAAVGGVIGVAVLAAAFLAWQSWSAVSEARDGGDSGEGLDSVVAKAASLSRKDVYPCAANVKAIDANRERFEEWRDEAARHAARGDRKFDPTTPAAFKEFLLSEAKRLSALPGSVDGAIVKPDFPFGAFREYILDGKLPPEAQLPKLQRQWDDVAFFVEELAKAGVGELTAVECGAAASEPEKKPEPRKGQKKPKRKDAKSGGDEGPKELVEKYTLQFTASPAAFARAVNALGVCDRFVTVDDFSFVRAKDDVKEAFDAQEKKDAPAAQPSSRRSRRSRRGESEATEEKKAESPREAAIRQGVVTDPVLATPLSVTLKLTVRDFGTLAAGEHEEEEEKK